MKNIRSTLLTALSLSVAAPFAHGQDPAALLTQCVKMPAGTPEQNACITAVQTQVAVMQAQAAVAQAAAAQAAGGKAGAKAPATGLKAPDAPPDVKKAAQQLGLAGSPPPGVPGAAPLPAVNISGMDIKAASAAMKQQQANLLQAHLNTQIPSMKLQAAQLAAEEAALAQITQAQAGMKGGIAQGTMSIGSGAAGMKALANMKDAGLDTSKIAVKNVNGVSTYEMSGKQAEAYKQELDTKKQQSAVDQQKQSQKMQDQITQNKQALDVMQKYMDTLAATQAKIIGNMH